MRVLLLIVWLIVTGGLFLSLAFKFEQFYLWPAWWTALMSFGIQFLMIGSVVFRSIREMWQRRYKTLSLLPPALVGPIWLGWELWQALPTRDYPEGLHQGLAELYVVLCSLNFIVCSTLIGTLFWPGIHASTGIDYRLHQHR